MKRDPVKEEPKFKKLRGRIIEYGLTHADIACRINLSETSFSAKINDKIDFKDSEIEKIIGILEIPPTSIDEFFFPNIYEKRKKVG